MKQSTKLVFISFVSTKMFIAYFLGEMRMPLIVPHLFLRISEVCQDPLSRKTMTMILFYLSDSVMITISYYTIIDVHVLVYASCG